MYVNNNIILICYLMTESMAFNYICIYTNKYTMCSKIHASIVCTDIKWSCSAVSICQDLNRKKKKKERAKIYIFFLFRLQENKQKQLQAEKKIVEAPGSNACSRPLLDVINWMMHYSVDDS